ncbi:ROK family protein [Microbacterium sp. SORGH_AS_0888]|uniref:ROK family protein n=1 Tax=Microbacterium sp. SORGH_AS_0888 TaxID=3041791 RepID=UPI0027824ECD|nr:ROK family protein [Microbacterium sp. SORGH_AS_0888]MDQ1131170.1 glucokinase [Microbacterium sp. SORGH_AS_0888]
MTYVLAVDVGGTKVESALVGLDGRIVPGTRRRADTGAHAARTPDALGAAVEHVVAATAALADIEALAGVGIASAGPIDAAEGRVSPLNLPAAQGYAIVDHVRRITGVGRVELQLDGAAIARAEHLFGAARGVRHALVMVVSTGVGGGLVVDGRVLAGRTGNAGHVGQIIVDRGRPTAAAATVEGLASGPATVAYARSLGWQGATGEDLAAAWAAGDPRAIAAVERSADAVGAGIASVAALLDLDLVVVGGGFAGVSPDYVERVQTAARAYAVPSFAAGTRVVRAALGGEGPLVGAAATILPDAGGAWTAPEGATPSPQNGSP